MRTDFQYPRWLHLGTFLYFMGKEDYNNLLIEASMFETPELFWSPLLKLISYHKLSRPEQSLLHFKELVAINPDFMDHAEEYISCLVKAEKLSKEMTEAVHAVAKSYEL